MWILKSRIDENPRIGTNISVTVPEVEGNQEKIDIHAPKSLPIH
ncbi:carbon storage regulator [Microbulbifer variabilis]|nr:carbon storage regulator [Microbulbifer variabilis]